MRRGETDDSPHHDEQRDRDPQHAARQAPVRQRHEQQGADRRQQSERDTGEDWVEVRISEHPERALVICFGVGNTLRAVSLHPSLKEIEVADLSLIFEQLASIRVRDPERSRALRQRYLAIMLVGLRAPALAALPGPPPQWDEVRQRFDPATRHTGGK